jgi:hypothetical protein
VTQDNLKENFQVEIIYELDVLFQLLLFEILIVDKLKSVIFEKKGETFRFPYK